MFPVTFHYFARLFGDHHLIFTTLALSAIQSFVNTILIYRVGKLIYKDRWTAELAAYLYIASFSVVYQITLYSENMFLMCTLLGLLVIHKAKPVTQNARAYDIPPSSAVLFACVFFGIGALSRSTGVILSIFVAFFLGNSFLSRVDRKGPAVRTVCTALLCIAIMFAPTAIIIYI